MPAPGRRWLAGGAAATIGLAATLGWGGDGDMLRVKPAVPDTAAVLVTAKPVGGLCPTFRTGELYAVVDRVRLDRNYTSGCAYSLTVFGVHHAVLVGNPETDWSDSIQEHRVATLPPPLVVELQVWNATSQDSAFEGMIEGDIKRANGVFRSRRAGMVLLRQPGIKAFIPRKPYAIAYECSAVEDSLGFQADPARINVVYVDGFVNGSEPESTASGYACPRHQGSSPVLFLSWKYANELTLAHEIAHVLGHSFEEFGKSGGGHTDHRGFPPSNLMARTAGLGSDPRTGFSLGQIFRVHLDSRSWVNRAKLRGDQLQLRCKDEDSTGTLIDSLAPDGLEPCPRLITGVEQF